LATTPPKTPWYKKPIIISMIAPILIVLAVGAGIGLAGAGLYQLVSGATILYSPSPTTGTAALASVSMPNGVGTTQSLNFQPSSVTISRGGSVTWTNNDPTNHTVTSTSVPSGAATFDSGAMTQNQTYRILFTVDGTYNYVCTYHAGWMKGTVTVTG
jgi:plastocyanin